MSFSWAVCPFLVIRQKNFLVKLLVVSPDDNISSFNLRKMGHYLNGM